MRVGVITAISSDGELVRVTVSTDGGEEQDIPVLDILGTRPTIAEGSQVLLLPHETTLGDHVAVPAAWRRASAVHDRVALLSDVQELADKIADNQDTYNGHTHTAPGGSTGVPLDLMAGTVTPTGSSDFEVTHG